MDAEITDAQVSYIWSLLHDRRVSAACASRIIQMLEDQPDPENGYPSQTEHARTVKERITRDDERER